MGTPMDLTEIFRFVAALAFIIGLIGVCAYAAKRFGFATGSFGGSAVKRLSVSEVKVLDAKHRLILVRRDGKEHLILMGGEHNLLIETGIDAPAMPEMSSTATPDGAAPAPGFQFQRIVDLIKERRA
jgi:flagellar protein FliO/FliZ